MPDLTKQMKEEIRRRRTFAIISHPDAGKTTLTEKFLLYGGAHQPGGERERKSNREARGVGLDGDREGERNLRYIFGPAV